MNIPKATKPNCKICQSSVSVVSDGYDSKKRKIKWKCVQCGNQFATDAIY